SLWFLAMDGEKIAGVSLCYPKVVEDPDMGWLSTLGVLPEYRKHGLGYTLLRHSFREFQRRGKKRVALGVDSSSLTGATRLYERAGMKVVRVHNLFEKVLRPGRDISTQTIPE
ncbi:MAG: GNAT family N-acetyltransferase, partial [Anaerolineaceae bacterium]|nr:GNAT family N-acetyltransferase [Anaerolineaceae bacterium]